jgi:Tfp pilus assembly PilM family ATPase
MEIGSQATARALIGKDNLAKSVLIVDIGAQQTSFIVVDKSMPLYTSSIPIAGNSLTEAIARGLAMPWDQAEKTKLSRGLVSQTEAEQGVRQAVLPILDNIIDETKNVIRFFEEHSQNHHLIDTILFCGGSSRVPGVMEYISTRMNMGTGQPVLKIAHGNAWSNIRISQRHQLPIDQEESLGYSTAIGLALRGYDEAD